MFIDVQSLRGIEPRYWKPTHFSRRLLIIKQNKLELHTILMEDCAQNIYYTHLKVHTNQISRIDWNETSIANIKT